MDEFDVSDMMRGVTWAKVEGELLRLAASTSAEGALLAAGGLIVITGKLNRFSGELDHYPPNVNVIY